MRYTKGIFPSERKEQKLEMLTFNERTMLIREKAYSVPVSKHLLSLSKQALVAPKMDPLLVGYWLPGHHLRTSGTYPT